MPSTKSHISFLFTLLAIVWGVLIAANTLRAQWSSPTAIPPGNNPASFLTTGINPESKSGVLTLTNNFYVIGSGSVGKVGIGTSTIESSSRLVVEPYTNASIDAGAGSIRTSWQAAHNDDVINKSYLTSTLDASIDSIKYWTLSGDNLYASSTAYNIAIGTTTAGTAKLAVIGGNVGIGVTSPGAKLTIIDPRDSVSDTATYNDFSLMLGHGVSNTNTAVGIAFHPSISSLGTPGAAIIAKRVGGYGVANLIFKTKEIGTADSPTLARMTIRSNGNVGIGTTTPMVSLHVEGNVVADTPLAANHLATKSYVDTAAQSLWVNNGSYLYASSTSWRVGIGTTSPASALHIYPQTGIEGLRIVSSNYSPLVISTAAGVDLFRVNQSGDVTAVTSSATRMRSNNYCDANGDNCFDPSSGWSSAGYFATVTTATYSGNNNNNPGYAYAHAQCNDQLAGTHVCSAEEILNTIRENDPNKPMPTVDVWIFNGPPGYTAMANDCDGRRSNIGSGTNTAYGSYWQMSDSVYLPHGRGLLYTCEKSLRFACCR
jgi:hypothetical protein